MSRFFYRMSEAEGKGLEDLIRFYFPHGPMRKVVTYLGPAGGVPIHVGHSENFDFDYMMRRMMGLSSLNTSIGETLFAGGKGADIPHMFVSTLGEAVERFLGSLAIYEKAEEIEYGTIKQMASRGHNCLGPEDLPLFHEEQFKRGDLYYQRFTEDSFLGWIEGKRLLSGDAVWLPVQIVALFYSLHPEEDLVGYSTSGGLASHISTEEALFHGITELIERDAVNLRWVSRMPPEPIELDRPIRSRGLQKLLEMSRGVPGGSTFYLQTTDIPEVPVVTVMEVCNWLKKWSYYAGGGVNLDIDEAMLQALTEFGQSERSLRLAQSAPDWGFSWGVRSMFDVDEDTPVSQIDIFFKIIAYYGYPKNVRKMDHYMNDGEKLGLSSLATDDSKTTERSLRQPLQSAPQAQDRSDHLRLHATPNARCSFDENPTFRSWLCPISIPSRSWDTQGSTRCLVNWGTPRNRSSSKTCSPIPCLIRRGPSKPCGKVGPRFLVEPGVVGGGARAQLVAGT